MSDQTLAPVKTVTLEVNGQRVAVTAMADTPLLLVLRNDLQLNGPKYGCGLGECGACTVIIDGVAARSCVFPLSGAGFPDWRSGPFFCPAGRLPSGRIPASGACLFFNLAKNGMFEIITCLNKIGRSSRARRFSFMKPDARQSARRNACPDGGTKENSPAFSPFPARKGRRARSSWHEPDPPFP